MTVMPMTITKAVPFVMAFFLLLSPSLLAGKPDGAVSQAPVATEANDSADIAQKLTNPLAAMISVPIQNWFDFNLGPRKDGFRYTMEAQPVYPVQISKDWNLLSRTTIPVVYQQNVSGRTAQIGLSDSTESLFLSPYIPHPLSGVRVPSFCYRQAPMDFSVRASSVSGRPLWCSSIRATQTLACWRVTFGP